MSDERVSTAGKGQGHFSTRSTVEPASIDLDERVISTGKGHFSIRSTVQPASIDLDESDVSTGKGHFSTRSAVQPASIDLDESVISAGKGHFSTRSTVQPASIDLDESAVSTGKGHFSTRSMVQPASIDCGTTSVLALKHRFENSGSANSNAATRQTCSTTLPNKTSQRKSALFNPNKFHKSVPEPELQLIQYGSTEDQPAVHQIHTSKCTLTLLNYQAPCLRSPELKVIKTADNKDDCFLLSSDTPTVDQLSGVTHERPPITLDLSFRETGDIKPSTGIVYYSPVSLKKASGRIPIFREDDYKRTHANSVFNDCDHPSNILRGGESVNLGIVHDNKDVIGRQNDVINTVCRPTEYEHKESVADINDVTILGSQKEETTDVIISKKENLSISDEQTLIRNESKTDEQIYAQESNVTCRQYDVRVKREANNNTSDRNYYKADDVINCNDDDVIDYNADDVAFSANDDDFDDANHIIRFNKNKISIDYTVHSVSAGDTELSLWKILLARKGWGVRYTEPIEL